MFLILLYFYHHSCVGSLQLLPQCKDLRVILLGDSKVAVGANPCLCLSVMDWRPVRGVTSPLNLRHLGSASSLPPTLNGTSG